MVKNRASVEAFFTEVLEGAGAEPKLHSYVSALWDEFDDDVAMIQARAGRIVEQMAIALQASLLVPDRRGAPIGAPHRSARSKDALTRFAGRTR